MASIISNVRERARQIFAESENEEDFIYFWDDFEEIEETEVQIRSIKDILRHNVVFLLHVFIFFVSGGLITLLIIENLNVLTLILAGLLLPSIVVSYLVMRSGYIGTLKIIEQNISRLEDRDFSGTDELLYSKYQNEYLAKFDAFRINMIELLRQMESNSRQIQVEINLHSNRLNNVYQRLDTINLGMENTIASAAIYQETRSYLSEVTNGIDKFTLSFDTALNNIDEISSLLNSIGKQTTMLALNAGIEAAKAGERGRGFEVVSSNLRRLAQHAMDSSNRTKAMSKEISESAKDALRSITAGMSNLQRQLSTTQDQILAFNTDLFGSLNDIDTARSQANSISSMIEKDFQAIRNFRF